MQPSKREAAMIQHSVHELDVTRGSGVRLQAGTCVSVDPVECAAMRDRGLAARPPVLTAGEQS